MRIELRDITMKFDDVTAVDRLNVTINDAELVSLLGPSGCGKSTTLFMLAGLYKPTSGQLFFGEKLVNDIEPEHREIGMVFQNYALYPHMTVLKNIMFPLRMTKVPKKEAEERAIEMAKLVQIDHLLMRKPKQLSGGQQQRVAIARALVKQPKLLLLDEPLSNLDARLRLEMREEIRRIQQEVGITTIFVTHDQEEAMSISDKVLLMKDGKFQQFSPPQQMYDRPVNAFVGKFMGNPPINMIPVNYQPSNQSLHIKDTKNSLQLDKQLAIPNDSEKELLLGVRAEDFFVTDSEDNSITARVELVERIGRDTLLTATVGELKIRALLDPEQTTNSGDAIKLSIRKDRYHLFDAESGQNVAIESIEKKERVG
ncbi:MULTISPECIES: ABC transporter ATP-binding protein [Sutcliffiella]|uniref:Sugar ABC transporter ATP-binding protein n=1 Tax=Sutcliffiella cohnii TaxID=33932 RepID=A0A223KL44_9BACI|nr:MULTISPECIES: ABC transporter ATP-binding protein [Sutcliffiella]AST90215.1 sugar ABC transporter ATP-binding protein [Sutcliffiella cohnii]WBL15865.1 ABC transporter ATP-binding protein [Sutcliffiella sp. NC1]